MITIQDLLRYWAGFPIKNFTKWVDAIEHLVICGTNKNPDFVCKHK